MAELLGMLFMAALLLPLYFLPTIMAARRRHKNFMPIFIINLILGATLFGWAIALAWAFTNNVYKDEAPKEEASVEA